MAPVTYTARELIRMRPLSARRELYDELYDKLHKDFALEEILRLPADRPLPLIEEETPSEGEREEATTDSDPTLVRQLDGTASEWKYKGRSEEEYTEPLPIPAPTGLTAQKDEGFQRFYKAVVSPTHVRVTAGGRIVPNTRASSSPTAKWTKDRLPLDGTYSARPASRDLADQGLFSHAQIPMPGMHPMYPAFSPAIMPTAVGGPAPFPLFPWHMYNTFGAPVGPSRAPDANNAQKDEAKSQQDGADEHVPSPCSGHPSPPGQFGHGRPFFFNGQWVMPGLPYGMPPMQNIHQSSLLGQHMYSPRFPAPAPAPSQTFQPEKRSEAHAPSQLSVSSASNTSTAGQATAPISSIRPSEITKKQIDVLRGSLKYLEDQLQYNKHQIDEKWMEYQAQMVRQQIQQFEKNLDSQRSFEESHYPRRREATSETVSSLSCPHSGMSSKSDAAGSLTHPDQGTFKAETARSHAKQKNENDRMGSRFGAGINSTKSVFAFAPMRIHEDSIGEQQPSKKTSRLPVNAALAKPFQPQNDSLACNSQETGYVGAKASAEENFFSKFSNLQSDAPYLVGKLPAGVGAEQARDTDYLYTRDLTEDELRARHMYWGKAPRHLQRGLPKFDGKDFYPPSPVRGQSTDFDSSQNEQATVGDSEAQSIYSSEKAEFDPFRSLGRPRQRLPRHALGKCTQSETLPRSTSSIRSTGSSVVDRPTVSSANMSGRSYNDFRQALESSNDADCKPIKPVLSSDDGDDDKGLLFKGRKPAPRVGTRSRNDIWQSVLRKGKSSGSALPGTISSTTARGLLPQYKGHASAYLAPTIANATAPVKQQNMKPAENGDVSSIHPAVLQGENLPPSDPADNASDVASNLPPCHRRAIVSP